MKALTGYPKLSEFGMWMSPHKKEKARGKSPREYAIGITKNGISKKGVNGHSGNKPDGKLKKAARLKTGPPGTPNGICTKDKNPNCQCGKHYEFNRG